MKQFKDILREKRKALGMSQLELGVEVGTTQRIVRNWESGAFYPNFNSLMKLADYFKCSLDELVGREKR